MKDHSTTPFTKRCEILSDIWLNYRKDKEFQDFVEYNDLGLPLSYLISVDLVTPSEDAKVFIEETWDVLLTALEIEDIGYETVNEMFEASSLGEEDWQTSKGYGRVSIWKT